MDDCDVYQAWVAARDEARDAYHGWCHAGASERRDAYSRYRAAADREDVAGDCFARLR
jgi:hypothetical protein